MMLLELPTIRRSYSSLRGLSGGVDAVALLTKVLPSPLTNAILGAPTRSMTGAEAAQAIVSSLSSKGYIVVDANSVNLSQARKDQIAADVKNSVIAALDDIAYANANAIPAAFHKFDGQYAIVQQSDLAAAPAPSSPSAPSTPSGSPAAPAAPAAPVLSNSAPGTSPAPNAANPSNNANPFSNLFHLPSVTPYTPGVGRHKAPPSFVEQWLPVGLVIAGVVLAIGFGSYAGRE